MNAIEEAIITSHFPELKVVVGHFKDKLTGEIGFCVTQVNNHHQVYNAAKFELVKETDVENTEMIKEVFYADLIKKIDEDRVRWQK